VSPSRIGRTTRSRRPTDANLLVTAQRRTISRTMIRITSSVPAPMYTSTPFSQPSHQSKRSAPATSATTVQIARATPPSMTNGVPAERPRVTASSIRPGGREGSASVGFVCPSSIGVWSVMRRGIPGRRNGKTAPRVSRPAPNDGRRRGVARLGEVSRPAGQGTEQSWRVISLSRFSHPSRSSP
jgi:hypothetical protein